MYQAIKESWEEFKKELTWNNIKIMICQALPTVFYLYGWTFWLKKLEELLNNSTYSNLKTIDQSIIVTCILLAMITPLWLAMFLPIFGAWLGRVTRFFVDNKTKWIVFDDVGYMIRDMPQDQREKIKEILSNYKSKVQLKRERLANESWLRRNFT